MMDIRHNGVCEKFELTVNLNTYLFLDPISYESACRFDVNCSNWVLRSKYYDLLHELHVPLLP